MKIFTYLILYILFSNFLFPQELIWKHTGGPMGGIVGDIAIAHTGKIFAGMYPFLSGSIGLYQSSDNGNNWEKIETQFSDLPVYSIYITDEGDIWAGTDGMGRLYRSTDNGETWYEKSNGYFTPECWAIVKNKAGVLVAGDAEWGRIYRSTDNGENWVYSASNEIVALVNQENPPGSYEIEFDGGGLSSGIYFYKMQADKFIMVRKLILLK